MQAFQAYLEALCRINGIGDKGAVEWLFYDGMLFGSHAKWWGDWRVRSTCHEGIDICWYRTGSEKRIQCFTLDTRVAAISDGIVLNICPDFLGTSLVVEHGSSAALRRVVTYAHIAPDSSIQNGDALKQGQVIASVSNTHKNPDLPPHLHFSCFEMPKTVQAKAMDWSLFTDPSRVNMIHPVFL